jgi:alpha-ketoglutarate-dependent taurine dioxygenase
VLDFHTEVAFHPAAPDYLLLFCLRSDHDRKAQTIFSGIKKTLSGLDSKTRKLLRQPLYTTGIDYSFCGKNAEKGRGPTLSILRGPDSDPVMFFDPDLMVGANEEAQAAIATLKAELDRNRDGIVLSPGDLLIVDNLRQSTEEPVLQQCMTAMIVGCRG